VLQDSLAPTGGDDFRLYDLRVKKDFKA